MNPQSAYSPVSLRYIAALRGNKPPKTGIEFSYAEVGCASPENLICLAASNPEGRFYGILADDTARKLAEDMAVARGTFNVIFLAGSPSTILENIAKGSALPPMLDYLVCNELETRLSQQERTALFDLADKRVNPGGLFVTSYRAYEKDDGALRFIVQEFAPEMSADQKQTFLAEIKKLGSVFLSRHPDMAESLNKAIADNNPASFLSAFEGQPATSGTFDTLVAARSRGFDFAGDALLASNFVELAVPHEAQELIVTCRDNPLYEPIKDLALDRMMRSDIWIKLPAEQSDNPAELFGGFAYGLMVPEERVPPAFAAKGMAIDLSTPLHHKILHLMSLMPVGVGDILTHETSSNEDPAKVLEAIQVLVACGFVCPMRGALAALNIDTEAPLRFSGNFNRYVDRITLSDKDVLFASQIAGCGITLPAREAFVMQAINRAGLIESIPVLMHELGKIANTPAAQNVINAEEPTQEIAHQMVIEVVQKSLPQWYAYALLEAA